MLSTESASVIRATLPAAGGALDKITTRFYATMFADRPELLDGMFNCGNQASGAQRQALAGSIAAYASALVHDPATAPDALLDRIAHKHGAVGVTEDQYTSVHKYLFAAIAEVLGDAVTADVAAAWDEVYWQMAGALIAREARLYQAAEVTPGNTGRPGTVVDRRQETPDTVSFSLRPADRRPAPRARGPAGPRRTVRQCPRADAGRCVPAAPVQPLRRPRRPGGPAPYHRQARHRRRRRPDGEVSALLHDTVHEGDELVLSAPFGDIVLDGTDAPLVLVSAGIGCTPMVGMLDHLAATGSTRPVLVLRADRSPADHALREETRRLVGELPDASALSWYENPDGGIEGRPGLMDLAGVELPAKAQVYLCDPVPFMRAARAQLRDAAVPADRIHYEVFGPDLWLADVAA
jgi:nitric oxide dioxygenase